MVGKGDRHDGLRELSGRFEREPWPGSRACGSSRRHLCLHPALNKSPCPPRGTPLAARVRPYCLFTGLKTPHKKPSPSLRRGLFVGQRELVRPASFRGKKSRALRAALSGFLRTARPFPSQAAAARAFFVKGEQKNQAPAAAGSKKPGKPHHKFFQGRAPQPESKGSCPEPFSDKPRSRAFFQVLSRSRFEAGNSASCRIRLSAIFFISGVSCRYFFITSEEVSFRGG